MDIASIDELTTADLHRYADTWLRLIAEHGRVHTAQLHEYVSLRLKLHLHGSHKAALTDYVLSLGGKRDKSNANMIQMPVKREFGLPTRRKDRTTVDMFEAAQTMAVAVKAAAKPTAPKLRWYQEEAVAAILASLKDNRSTLCVLATGGGKTRVAAELARLEAGRVCFLAHRDELIKQSNKALAASTGEFVGTEKAEHRAGNTRVVTATIQTISKRLDQFSTDHFALTICDEAHHSVSPQWQATLNHFKTSKVVGITATPKRKDERAMGRVYDDVSYVMETEDLIDDGYLVPIKAFRVFVEEVDLGNVGTVGDDLNQGELDEEMLKATESVVVKTYELAGSEQVITFTPGVKSAHAMAARMNEIAPGKAVALDGSTDSVERAAAVAAFSRGDYQYMYNCALFTEGTDFPSVSFVAIARPTQSSSLLTQMCGRPLRVLPGVVDHIDGKGRSEERQAAIAASRKPHATILDFVGNDAGRYLASIEDVLGGAYSEEEVAAAKKKAREEGGPTDPLKALKDARAELKAMAQRMAAAKAKVKAQITPFDPFACLGISREQGISIRFGAKPIMDWQVEKLTRFGLPEETVKQMDFRTAKKTADRIHQRINDRLASIKQLNVLARYAPTSDALSFETASKAIDYIARSNWRPNPQQLNAILESK